MSKDLNVNTYLDFYESLLTEKQRNVMNMYYREDYSLSEIAEILEISRPAVNDLIKRVEKILKSYEDKLHLVDKFDKRMQIYELMNDADSKAIHQYVQQLKDLE